MYHYYIWINCTGWWLLIIHLGRLSLIFERLCPVCWIWWRKKPEHRPVHRESSLSYTNFFFLCNEKRVVRYRCSIICNGHRWGQRRFGYVRTYLPSTHATQPLAHSRIMIIVGLEGFKCTRTDIKPLSVWGGREETGQKRIWKRLGRTPGHRQCTDTLTTMEIE